MTSAAKKNQNQREWESPFRQQLIRALEHFTEPEWLGENSPLAAPYFLGDHLLNEGEKIGPRERGQILQALLLSAAEAMCAENQENLSSEEGSYLNKLLCLSFFTPIPLPQLLLDLGISRATYYRPAHRPRAIRELENSLLGKIKPALRIEEPPAPPPFLIERREQHVSCSAALSKRQSLLVTGSAGTGKTTFASQIVLQWSKMEDGPYFWYTVRFGLNDRLSSVLFAIGHFLHIQGASLLWMQMLASSQRQETEMLLGLLRRDLKSLESLRLLFCFDEVDQLDPLQHESHAQIIGLLNILRHCVPLLLCGQKAPLDPDLIVSLDGLDRGSIAELMQNNQICLSHLEIDTLFHYTNGNLRLLYLFMSLHESGDSVAQLLPQLSKAPSVESLLRRIWQRLDEDEAEILGSLSVFRRPAPSDAYLNMRIIERLMSRRLILIDEHGGIGLLPAFKGIIYRMHGPEERASYHFNAAKIRAERGEVTAASYHYIEANQPAFAVWLWYEQRRQEVDQGQGIEALSLFESLSREQLPEPEREILVLLRSELRMLVGDYNGIKRDVYTTSWQSPLLRRRAKRIEGDLAIEQSQFDVAIRAYRDGLDGADVHQLEISLLYTRVGEALRRKRDLQDAWQESVRARYEVTHLQGDIQYNWGNYEQARCFFVEALNLAKQINYVEGEGRTRNNLALIHSRKCEYEEAIRQWDLAGQCYEKVGHRTWQAGIKINQAGVQIALERPQTAVTLLDDAYAVYDELNHSRGRAITAFQLAEAHLKLTNLETANEFAWQSLQEEEQSIMAANFGILADIALARGMLDDAEVFCGRSIELSEETNDIYSGACAWRTRGQVWQRLRDLDQANFAFEQATMAFQELDLEDEIAEISRLRSSHAEIELQPP